MLIGNLPEDTTPAPDGYVPYSEDGIHLNRISRDNLIKGAGHGTGMVYWEEGDGQIVTEGGHTNIPRTVVGSLYSYAIEDDGIAYWFAIYPSAYWSSEITEEVRNVWELAYEDSGEITYIAYMDNQGNVNIKGTNNAGAALTTLKARNFVYVDDDGVETNLLDYFMTKFTVGDGLYFGEEGGSYESTLFAIGATQISINGMNFQLQNGSFDLDFGDEFMYVVNGANVRGLTITGNKISNNITFTNSITYFVPRKSLFFIDNDGYSTPLTEAYGLTNNVVTTPFLPDRLYYYNAAEDSYLNQDLDSNYIFTSFKKVPINAMYNLTLEDGDVYLVGTFNSSGYFVLDSIPFTQTLPTTENGKIYILLGTVAGDYLDFQINRPKYWYKDGSIREYAYAEVDAPITDIYINGATNPISIVGDNGKTGFNGVGAIQTNSYSSQSGGSKILNISLNTDELAPSLPTNMLSYKYSLNGSVGRNGTYIIPYGFSFETQGYPYAYLNVTLVVYRQDSSALTGGTYKAWLALSGDSNMDQVPYDNGEGGYFKDVISPLSGDTEVVLGLSGLWKIDNYTQTPSGVSPVVILELDTAEALYIDVIVEATKINTPTT